MVTILQNINNFSVCVLSSVIYSSSATYSCYATLVVVRMSTAVLSSIHASAEANVSMLTSVSKWEMQRASRFVLRTKVETCGCLLTPMLRYKLLSLLSWSFSCEPLL